MNRNEIVGKVNVTTIGYAVQSFVYAKVVNVINPQSIILLRTGTR